MTPIQEMTRIKSYIKSILRDSRKKHTEEDIEQLQSFLCMTDLCDLRQAFKFYLEWMNFEKKGFVKKDGVLFQNIDEPTKIYITKANDDLKKSYRECRGVKCLWHTPKGTYTEPGRAAQLYPDLNYKDVIRQCNSDDPKFKEWFAIDIQVTSVYELHEDLKPTTEDLPYIEIEELLTREPLNE